MNNRWNLGAWQVDLDQGWLARRPCAFRKKIRPDARLISVMHVLIDNAG